MHIHTINRELLKHRKSIIKVLFGVTNIRARNYIKYEIASVTVLRHANIQTRITISKWKWRISEWSSDIP